MAVARSPARPDQGRHLAKIGKLERVGTLGRGAIRLGWSHHRKGRAAPDAKARRAPIGRESAERRHGQLEPRPWFPSRGRRAGSGALALKATSWSSWWS